MTIRKCPACAQLIHFTEDIEIETCWNCGRTATLAHVKLFEQKVADSALRFFDTVSELHFGPPSYNRGRRLGLLATLPIAIAMLLICNSLDINGGNSLIFAYGSDRIPMPQITCQGISW